MKKTIFSQEKAKKAVEISSKIEGHKISLTPTSKVKTHPKK